jgi:hypothetical protein
MKLQAVGPRAIYVLDLISPGYLLFVNLKNLEILNGRISYNEIVEITKIE